MKKRFWESVNEVIEKADILLLVLDARLVDETRNQEIEDKAKGKPLIYVVTKSDLADMRDKVKNLKPIVFVSATQHFGLRTLRQRIIIESKRANIDKIPIKVGVLGYPNVGKSSLINAMRGAKVAKTSVQSGCTKSIQRVKSGKKISFLDTPGVLPYLEKKTFKHILIGSITFKDVKEPEYPVYDIMDEYPGMLEKHYCVEPQKDHEETLEKIALNHHMLRKGGVPDIQRMAKAILKDWQKGVILP